MNPLEGHTRYRFSRTLDTFEGKVVLAEQKRLSPASPSGRSLETTRLVAVQLLERGISSTIKRFVMNHSLVMHPHIVSICDLFLHGNYLCIAFEFAEGGNLLDDVTRSSGYPEGQCRRIMQQLMLGVQYCHKIGVMNMDLRLDKAVLIGAKPGNRQLIKICDFGGRMDDTEMQSRPAAIHGSAPYMAPEIFTMQQYDGRKVDVWACGVMLYAMLFARYPFSGEPQQPIHVLVARITKGEYALPTETPVSQECRDLLSNMLNPNPAQRFTADQVFRHPWLCYNMPERALSFNNQLSRDGIVDPAVLRILSEAQKPAAGYNVDRFSFCIADYPACNEDLAL